MLFVLATEASAVIPGRRQSRHLPWVSLRSKIGWLARTLPGSDRQKDPLDIEQEIHINFTPLSVLTSVGLPSPQ